MLHCNYNTKQSIANITLPFTKIKLYFIMLSWPKIIYFSRKRTHIKYIICYEKLIKQICYKTDLVIPIIATKLRKSVCQNTTI